MTKSHWIKISNTFTNDQAKFNEVTEIPVEEVQSIFAFIMGIIDTLEINGKVIKSSKPNPIALNGFLIRCIDPYLVEYCENDLRAWCLLNNAEYLCHIQMEEFMNTNSPKTIEESLLLYPDPEPIEEDIL